MDEPVGKSATRERGVALRALRSRDFRVLAIGNMVSQLGTWAQYVGLGAIAPELTDSKFLISVLFSALFLPYLLFSPFTGVIADRYDRRRIVLWGNLSMVLPAVAIGLLIQFDKLSIVALFVLVVLGGVGQTFTQPAATALVPSLVPVEDLHSAVALNAGMSNSTRVVGPIIGAAMMREWGIAWGFHIRAISFFAVMLACMTIKARPEHKAAATSTNFFAGLRSGIDYLRENRAAMHILVFVSIESFFMMHSSLMPVINREVLHGDVGTYGNIAAAPGFGFVAAAVTVTLLRTDSHRRAALILSTVGVGLALLTISVSRVMNVTLAALAVFGFAYMILTTVASILLLATTDDEYRGRVMGLYGTFAVGLFSVNAIIGGALAAWLGATQTVAICGAVILAVVALFCVSGSPRVIKTGLATRRADVEPLVAPSM